MGIPITCSRQCPFSWVIVESESWRHGESCYGVLTTGGDKLVTNGIQDVERLIKSAASKDEALEHAIAAIELYMQALGLAKSPGEKARLKGKCFEAMDRAEDIKKMDHWPFPGLANDMQGKSNKRVLEAPISTRELDSKEKRILLRSSSLHGSVFPQWTGEPSRDDFGGEKGLYT